MRRAGIRELRQQASALIRLVEAGETVEITDRGRPVALLTPIPDVSPLERLRAAGEVIPATGSIDDLPEPIKPTPGVPLPSEILAELRRDER
jgi:prevent-host-death family protein